MNLATKDSFIKGEKSQFTFTPDEDIGTMIRNILFSSKDVNELIGKSKAGLTQPFHPNVMLPVIQGHYYLKDDSVDIIYDIVLYKGGHATYGGIPPRPLVFEFNYYFSGAGMNVDVLDFETRFPKMIAWMSASKSGTDLSRNANSQIPAEDAKFFRHSVVHEDTTRTTLNDSPQDPKPIDTPKNGVAYAPSVNRAESTGYVKHEAAAVPAARLAFETYALAYSALDLQMSFTIRGHLNILDNVISHPDGSAQGFGVVGGVWLKVNIFNSDGSPFFYTGYYRLISVENIFANGKFTQLLTVLMVDTAAQ